MIIFLFPSHLDRRFEDTRKDSVVAQGNDALGEFQGQGRWGGEETGEWRVCPESMTFRVMTLLGRVCSSRSILVEPRWEGFWGFPSYKRLARTVSEETADSLAGAFLSSLSDRYKHSLIPHMAWNNSFHCILLLASCHNSPPSVSYLLALRLSHFLMLC